MTPRRPSLACSTLLLALCLAACDQGETPIGGFDDEGCDPTAGDDGGVRFDVGAPGTEPIAVDCSFSFDGVTETLRFEANVESEARVIGGALNLNANLFDDDAEGRSFSVTLYDEAGTVGSTALYQFASGTRPLNEFLGQHGFTGLNWVKDPASGESVQYACFARDPADPIEGWEE